MPVPLRSVAGRRPGKSSIQTQPRQGERDFKRVQRLPEIHCPRESSHQDSLCQPHGEIRVVPHGMYVAAAVEVAGQVVAVVVVVIVVVGVVVARTDEWLEVLFEARQHFSLQAQDVSSISAFCALSVHPPGQDKYDLWNRFNGSTTTCLTHLVNMPL